MNRGPAAGIVLTALSLALLVGGCGKSPPVRFYMLSAKASPRSSSADPIGGVALAQVGVPKYIDRPQIVSRIGSHRMVVAEFDRWAEPLESQIPRVLEENLAKRLGTACLPAGPHAFDVVDYRVRVGIMQLDGTLGEEAVLETSWRIDDSGGQILVPLTRSRYVVAVPGDGYEAFAAAVSDAIGQLSVEIANAILATK